MLSFSPRFPSSASSPNLNPSPTTSPSKSKFEFTEDPVPDVDEGISLSYQSDDNLMSNEAFGGVAYGSFNLDIGRDFHRKLERTTDRKMSESNSCHSEFRDGGIKSKRSALAEPLLQSKVEKSDSEDEQRSKLSGPVRQNFYSRILFEALNDVPILASENSESHSDSVDNDEYDSMSDCDHSLVSDSSQSYSDPICDDDGDDGDNFTCDFTRDEYINDALRRELELQCLQKISIAKILGMSSKEIEFSMTNMDEAQPEFIKVLQNVLCAEDSEDARRAKQRVVDVVRLHPQFGSELFTVEEPRVKLIGLNLADMDFSGLDLIDVLFTGSDLSRADLRDSKIRYIRFTKTNCTDANFDGAKLAGTTFEDSDLSNASFEGANIERLDLINTNVSGVNFKGKNLCGASFCDVNLKGMDFSGAILREAQFMNVNLTEARFYKVNLERASFSDADLTDMSFKENLELVGLKFSWCTLRGVDFQGAYFEGVNFERTDLSETSFSGTRLFQPIFYNVNVRGLDMDGAQLAGLLDLSTLDFSRAYLGAVDLSNATVNGKKFYEADLTVTSSFPEDLQGGVRKKTFKPEPRPKINGSNNSIVDFYHRRRLNSGPQLSRHSLSSAPEVELKTFSFADAASKVTVPPKPLKIQAGSTASMPKKPQSLWTWFVSLPSRAMQFLRSIQLNVFGW